MEQNPITKQVRNAKERKFIISLKEEIENILFSNHKKIRFLLKISLANADKFTFTKKTLNGKLHN